ncbi:MAG: penicillin-binding protein activator, partial [Gammaproteobacteria bacterium]|nr:penicillin-binding protein activator [Gammaproteobacteria bacterium]
LEDEQNWAEAFSAWSKIAEESQQPNKTVAYNNAALMLYYNQQIDYLEDFYNSLDSDDIAKIGEKYKNTLLATSYFKKGKTYQSLATLPDLKELDNSRFLIIALNTKAEAVLNIGKPIQSTKLRLQAHTLQTSEEAIAESYKNIWNAISRISESRVLKTLAKPQTADLRGWLELSLIARRSNMLPLQMEPWIKKWNLVYPNHHAEQFAQQLLKTSQDVYINPTKIAFMLPLEGKLSKVAKAIQDGFLYAYYLSGDDKPEIEIIAVNPEEAFTQQYNSAVEDGADFVVGPLNKSLISQLASSMKIEVPTLALNYSNEDKLTHNLFEYGLKPEDEASQVADYALLDEKYTAATLMPDTSWGERINNAFKDRYELLGGTIQTTQQYPSKSNDYGTAIKKLLNLDKSKSRHSTIQTVIGEKAVFTPRRRQDIDMIFMGANSRQARLIKPQLKFHYAQDIQVYATSHISNSTKSPDKDRDLNDVYFVDMPWSLKSKELKEHKDINQLWPQRSQTYSRLFAMGIDAYRMIPQLKRLMLNPEEKYKGLTGTLTVDKFGKIHRELLLATYEKGKSIEITEQVRGE